MRNAPPRLEFIKAKALRMNWICFIFLLLIFYLLVACIFAVFYSSQNRALEADSSWDFLHFSLMVQTTFGNGDYTLIGPGARRLVIMQALFGLFYFAVSTALIVFRLLRAPKEMIRFDIYTIFYPKDKCLKFRVYSRTRFRITNVNFDAYLHCEKYRQPGQRQFHLSNMPIEAGKCRLNGDTIREAGSDEIKGIRDENDELKMAVAELTLRVRKLKKPLRIWNADPSIHEIHPVRENGNHPYGRGILIGDYGPLNKDRMQEIDRVLC